MSSLKRNPDIGLDDLSSDFDPTEAAQLGKKLRKDEFYEKQYPGEVPRPGRSEGKKWFQEEHGRMHRQLTRLATMDAYQRHKEMINLYYLNAPGANRHILERDTSRDRTDYDVLKDHHKFLWSAEDEQNAVANWELRLAKKYHDKLFKEYCICDLSQYKHNRVAMRWRVENEVRTGKGQFICGGKKCDRMEDLSSWEVNFTYVESGEKKSALVKLRLCPECADRLNYGSKKRKVAKKSLSKWTSRKDKRTKSEGRKGEDANGKQIKEEEPGPSTSVKEEKAASDIWSGPQQIEEQRTVDDDIDEFLNDVFD